MLPGVADRRGTESKEPGPCCAGRILSGFPGNGFVLFGKSGWEWLVEVAENELRPVSRWVIFETLTMIDQLDAQTKELK